MLRLKNVGSIFILLLILFLPLPIPNISITETISTFLFQDLIQNMAQLFSIQLLIHDFSSDSKSLFMLIALLFSISLLMLCVAKDLKKLHKIVRLLSCYYLILTLLSYGFNKVFLYQFPAPEANILFSRFGYMEKDILYWSVLGLSPMYTITTGLIECLIALLILFSRTRLLGLIMALFSFMYILLINISFDISVKLYASILILISLYQLLFYKNKIKQIVQYILGDKVKKSATYIAIKMFVFLVFISIISIPYILNIKAEEPLSASYSLESKKCEHDLACKNQFTKMFFLKQGYVVFEKEDGSMLDYRIVQFNHQLVLERENKRLTFEVSKNNNFDLVLTQAQCQYLLRAISLDNLPIFKHKNHLFVDDVD